MAQLRGDELQRLLQSSEMQNDILKAAVDHTTQIAVQAQTGMCVCIHLYSVCGFTHMYTCIVYQNRTSGPGVYVCV